MSKVLVVPDVHGRTFWKEPCEKWDGEIIFLGDFFDPYPQEGIENPDENSKQAINFILDNKDRCSVLLGNHDAPYLFSGFTRSSRYSNNPEYREWLGKIKDLIKTVIIKNEVIFSHAGITDDWAHEFLYYCMKYEDLDCDLVLETAQILQDTPLSEYDDSYIRSLDMIGSSRGGIDGIGSCIWADITEHFNRKISGFVPKTYPKFQVFAHTWVKYPIMQECFACLDVQKCFVVDTQTKEIEEYV